MRLWLHDRFNWHKYTQVKQIGAITRILKCGICGHLVGEANDPYATRFPVEQLKEKL